MAGYTHIHGNVFKVESPQAMEAAYHEWLSNEMEDEDLADHQLTVFPEEGYPMNVEFVRTNNGSETFDEWTKQPSDDDILKIWAKS
jgi:hypothetical protein